MTYWQSTTALDRFKSNQTTTTTTRAVYKQRGDSTSPHFANQSRKLKKLWFLVDVSGSMYRFNSYDGRYAFDSRMRSHQCQY
jgi:hypothetical protein